MFKGIILFVLLLAVVHKFASGSLCHLGLEILWASEDLFP